MADAGTAYPRPPIVLIVTGHEWLSLSIESVFAARGYAVLRAFTGLQAARQLAVSVDLLIVDRDLRDATGVALCRDLLAQGLLSIATPTILISADPWARDEKLEALRAGAWDVASLPWDAEELFLRMDAWVRAKLAGDAARDQGLIDPATGLYNAQGVLRRITELAAGAARHRRPLGVVVVTRNGVTQANEQGLRQSSPDREFVELLKAVRRASDAVGRLNATQFVVLAPETGEAGVIALAERLRTALNVLAGPDDASANLHFGCYAVPDFREASIAPTELLVRAAAALNEGTSNGGEPIRFFSKSLEN